MLPSEASLQRGMLLLKVCDTMCDAHRCCIAFLYITRFLYSTLQHCTISCIYLSTVSIRHKYCPPGRCRFVYSLCTRNVSEFSHLHDIALPSIPDFAPKVSKMEVLTTTATSITFQFCLIAENPTEYYAHIPYLSLMLEKGGNILANASVTGVDISPGDNLVLVKAVYEPRGMDGTQTEEAIDMGLALLGDYVSGKNATVTVRPHRNSIPGFPELGEALSELTVSLPIPHLLPPSSHDPDDTERRPFLVGATMHIISSTASFLLHNPFPKTPIRIFSVSGTAMYNDSKLGTIEYDDTWELLAGSLAGEGGLSVSPRMPVHMHLRGAANKALKDALGRGLRIDAFARAEVGVGDWRGCVEFVGGGLQAAVRL